MLCRHEHAVIWRMYHTQNHRRGGRERASACLPDHSLSNSQPHRDQLVYADVEINFAINLIIPAGSYLVIALAELLP